MTTRDPIRLATYEPLTQRMVPADAGVTVDLFGVWGSSPADIWAVGASQALFHFDGGSWAPVPLGFCSGSDLTDVWGTAAQDVWIVGAHSCVVHFTDGGFADESLSGIDEPLEALRGLSETELWIGGRDGVWKHAAARTWALETGPGPNVHALAAFNGTMFSAADSAQVMRRDPASGAWQRMVVPVDTGVPLYGIDGANGSGLFAVGQLGVVLHRR